MSQNNSSLILDNQAALAALQWHIDNDLADMILEEPLDRTAPPDLSAIQEQIEQVPVQEKSIKVLAEPIIPVLGAAEAITKAKEIAHKCKTLEELQTAIKEFEGLSLKKTATNMVFADGNPKSDIMVIGEAPGAEEDAQGKPFIGDAGKLLDKILNSIELDREHGDMTKSAYLTNLLNWRPPGNRTPTAQEIEISLPFIRKHIELVQPKYLIILGAVAGKALLEQKDSISKLRGRFYNYGEAASIQAFVTYHPTYLLRTPAQKRAVWADMLMLKASLETSN